MAVVQAPYAGVDVNFDVSNNKIYYVDNGGPPASGVSYNVGDLALIVPVNGGVAPTSLSPLGYRCITGGSSAVWATLGSSGSYTSTAVASATSITPTAKVMPISGAVAIQTIVATGLNAGDTITLLPQDASTFTTITGGNILLATTGVRYKALIMTFDGTNFWPSY